MNVEELRMPAIFAWLFFAPGVALIAASIIRLQIDGLTVLGAVFLVLWVWLLGGFRREFWISDGIPAEPVKVDALDWALGLHNSTGDAPPPSVTTSPNVPASPVAPRP